MPCVVIGAPRITSIEQVLVFPVRHQQRDSRLRQHIALGVYTPIIIHWVVSGDVFAILADPTRRRLVEILHDGESSVNDLVEAVEIAQPGVSRHLKILSEAGMVQRRSAGQRRLYSLRPQSLRQLDAWVRRYVHDQSERLDRLANLIEEEPQ